MEIADPDIMGPTVYNVKLFMRQAWGPQWSETRALHG
jgi:hypothetical protein